jgi:hypothetical protein
MLLQLKIKYTPLKSYYTQHIYFIYSYMLYLIFILYLLHSGELRNKSGCWCWLLVLGRVARIWL